MYHTTRLKMRERSVIISKDAGRAAPSTRSGHSLCSPSIYYRHLQSMSHFFVSEISSAKVSVYQCVCGQCSFLTPTSSRSSILHNQFLPVSLPPQKVYRQPSPSDSMIQSLSLSIAARMCEDCDGSSCQQQRRNSSAHFHSASVVAQSLARLYTIEELVTEYPIG